MSAQSSLDPQITVVTAFDWSLDGSSMVVASFTDFGEGRWGNGNLRIVDTSTRLVVRELHAGSTQFDALITDVMWYSNEIITSDAKGYIRRYDVTTGAIMSVFGQDRRQVTAIGLDPTGVQLVAARDPGPSEVYDLATGNLVGVLSVEGRTPSLIAIAWSPDGTKIAGIRQSGTVYIWSASNLSLLQSFSSANEKNLRALDWSPDGSHLVTVGASARAYIWDVNNGSLVNTLGPFPDRALAVDWSMPDTIALGLGSTEVNALVWNIDRNVQLFSRSAGFLYTRDVRLQSDGTLAFAGAIDPASQNTGNVSDLVNIATNAITSLPSLTPLCTLDPATTRNWRITNLNASEQNVTWQLFNSPTQMGTVTIPANGTYDFSTTVEAGNETMRLIVGGQVVAEATGSAEPC